MLANTATRVADDFRQAMRVHAAGVTILTTCLQGRRFGMMATAVTSLSMDPPALVACINREASIYKPLLERGMFCVNVLRGEDAALCRQFSSLPTSERFSVGSRTDDEHDLPRLKESQASVVCRIGPVMDFGSHSIIVGEVLGASVASTGMPLIYFDCAFRSYDAQA